MTMSSTVSRRSLPGYDRRVGTITITYSCNPGVQGPEHPNPGVYVHFVCIF